MDAPEIVTDVPSRAMVVIPHPDDGEIGCGGTLARWASRGCKVVYVLCTNGDKGATDPEVTSEELVPVREHEQRNAARVVGVSEVVFLGHPDGELEETREFRGELVREIRRHRPEALFCTDPFRENFYLHRDHRIAGRVALDAVFPYARDHLHYPEHIRELGLSTHKVQDIYIWGTEQPGAYVDITETLEQKVHALKQHLSQVNSNDRDVGQFIRDNARRAGEAISVEAAEAFRHIAIRR